VETSSICLLVLVVAVAGLGAFALVVRGLSRRFEFLRSLGSVHGPQVINRLGISPID